MPVLEQRQQAILAEVTQQYIRTARPVSSQAVAVALDADVSPATVRNDMQQLNEIGYLHQPHASAGRIPTDRAYRFFVDHIPENGEILTTGERSLLSRAFALDKESQTLRALTKALARLSSMYVVATSADEHFFHATGFYELCTAPEFLDAAYLRDFARFADAMEECMDAIAELASAKDAAEGIMRVFIGRENPLRRAHRYTMIVTPLRYPNGHKGLLALVGPKRTDYQRHHALITYLQELVKTYHD